MRMLLAGQWVDRDKSIEVRDPFDDSVIDTVPAATAEDVETALGAADAARGVARAMTSYERSQILLKTAAIVADHLETGRYDEAAAKLRDLFRENFETHGYERLGIESVM